MAPIIIENGFIRVQPPNSLAFIYHTPPDSRGRSLSYKAIVKATKDGRELFLTSTFRIDRTGVRATFKRTISLEEWNKQKG
jgi:hypothetical protein